MKPIIVATLILLPNIAMGQNAKPNWPDCYCTDKAGDRLELGDTICMSVDGRDFLAQCQMSLNVPMWRELGEGCNMSLPMLQSTPQSLNPPYDPLFVRTKV